MELKIEKKQYKRSKYPLPGMVAGDSVLIPWSVIGDSKTTDGRSRCQRIVSGAVIRHRAKAGGEWHTEQEPEGVRVYRVS